MFKDIEEIREDKIHDLANNINLLDEIDNIHDFFNENNLWDKFSEYLLDEKGY